MKEPISTNYASNTVACRLWGMVDSPTEFILGMAVFEKLANFYEHWSCWVYSESGFRKLVSKPGLDDRQGTLVIVPQLTIEDVGRVDFAVFIPGLSIQRPIVVLECDGHNFHERTREQASNDRKRDRTVSNFGIPVLRFTGTDIVRNSAELAHEIADFIDGRADEKEYRWFQDNGIDVVEALKQKQGFYAPYPWPRSKSNSKVTAFA